MSSNANILQRLESIADDPESLKQYPITPEILSIYKTTMLGLINKALLARYEVLMKARATYGTQLGKEGAASVIRAVFPRSAKS